MLKWLLENPWVVIVIAGLVAQVLKALNRGAPGAAGGEEPPVAKEFEFEDAELAERTRKIREDIRRKIEERRGQHTRPPEPMPERPPLAPADRSPEATPPPVMGLPELIREVLQPQAAVEPPVISRAESLRDAEEAERQAALMEKLREAELMKAAAQRRVAFEEEISDKQEKMLTQTRGVVLDDLRDPAALRRAFILREVIGPPVALR